MLSRQLIFLLCFWFASCALWSHDEPKNLHYIRNNGQWEENVLYRTDFRGGKLFLEQNTFTYLFYPAEGFSSLHPHAGGKSEPAAKTFQFHSVKVEFENGNPSAVEGEGEKEYYHNYYLGNDSRKWASHVPLYESVMYRDMYRGISVRTLSEMNHTRYDLILAPNADASQIKLKYSGQEYLSIRHGHLYLKTSVGEIQQQAPFAYQIVNGRKKEIACSYILNKNNVSFALGEYDHSAELIIDPTLVFSTFTGSTADNWGMTATYDAAGDGYTSGICFGTGYPTTTGAFQSSYGGGVINSTYNYGGFDIVVSKFNPTGTNLLFSTYLGGTDNEAPQSIIVDNNNNLVLMGRSYSSNYPVTPGAYDMTLNGPGSSDIVVTKFNASGTALLASTFVGGTLDDGVSISAVETYLGSLKYNYADDGRSDVIVDASNNVYVASCTMSSNFPVTAGCAQSANAGQQDACVFKLDASFSSLLFSTYLGGSMNDAAYNIALGSGSEVYVTGGTESGNFPTTTGVLHTSYGGSIDGFVTHLNSNGSSIINSSYIGTAAYDQSYFIQIDKFGKIYLYGQSSGSYPVTSGVYSNAGSGQFIHCINSTLSGTFFSTVFGTGKGTPDIAPSAFLVDNCENIYCSGWGGTLFGYNVPTSTTYSLPLTSNAFQNSTDGSDFYFFVLQPNATALSYATFMGGGLSQEHVDGGTSRFDKSGVIYQAICEGCGGYSDLPTTTGAWSNTNNSFNCNNALVKFKFDPVITIANFSVSPSITVGCAPLTLNFTNSSSNAATYTWYFGDGTSSTQTNPSHVYTAVGNYTVTMVAKDTTTCNIYDTAYAYVRVTPNPSVTVAPAGPICQGSSVQLNASSSSALTYTWSPATALSNIHVANPTASPSVTTQYIVTVADSFCTASDTVLITVFPATTPTITGSNLLCSGDSTQLSTTTTFSTYQWSTGQTTPSTWVLSAGMYSVTTTDIHGCLASGTFQVNVMPSPVASYSLNSNNGCTPFVATFSCTGVGANTFYWDFGDGTTSNLSATTHTYALPGTYSVTLIVTNTVTCNHPDTAHTVITVAPSPTVSITPPPPYCVGDTVQLNATSSTAVSYSWSPTGGLSSSTIPNPYANPSVTTIYTLTVNDGTCPKSDTVTVHVFPPNNTQITASSQLCAGDSVVLTAVGPAIQWNWATGQTSQVIVVFAPGTYVVNTIDANGCTSSSYIDVHVFYPVTLSTRDTVICEGKVAPIQVAVNPAGNYVYNWQPPTGLSNPHVYDPLANPSLTTHYTVTVTNGPCVSKDTLNVTVYALPKVTVSPHLSEVIFGEAVTLVATSNYPVMWTPVDFLSCVNCFTTTATPERNITYYAIATNELGCQAMDTARIEIEPSLYIPNAFTPNGDFHNQEFKVYSAGYTSVEVYIFDRWGNEVIHWTDLSGSWDGTYKGKPAQEDVYVYKVIAIDFRKKEIHRSGIINLIR